jgi:hypothetical protein
MNHAAIVIATAAWRLGVSTGLTCVLLIALGLAAVQAQPPDFLTPFAPNSPFRSPIPSSAEVDQHSDRIVAKISRDDALIANLTAFAIPIYAADENTPRYSVQCTMPDLGSCPFSGHQVPIPDGAAPNPGSDGAMVIVDNSSGLSFEFWQARHANNEWTTSFGAINRLDGQGWSDVGTGSATASGASRLGGIIRIAEIAQGDIPHALALQSTYVCANVFRSPATNTDGRYQGADCIPEGARIRLDPAVDVNALSATSAERAVAQALQTYGGYVVDYGGAPLSVSFELDTTAPNGTIGTVYEQAGLRWDYDSLPLIPWNRLQVMA